MAATRTSPVTSPPVTGSPQPAPPPVGSSSSPRGHVEDDLRSVVRSPGIGAIAQVELQRPGGSPGELHRERKHHLSTGPKRGELTHKPRMANLGRRAVPGPIRGGGNAEPRHHRRLVTGGVAAPARPPKYPASPPEIDRGRHEEREVVRRGQGWPRPTDSRHRSADNRSRHPVEGGSDSSAAHVKSLADRVKKQNLRERNRPKRTVGAPR